MERVRCVWRRPIYWRRGLCAIKQVLAAFEREGVHYAIVGAVDDLVVSVVSPRTFYRMKRDTMRLKDRADAQLLKERFALDEEP